MNRPKIKGTAWESAIVTWLRERGWSRVERRALSGTLDKGDIAGIPWVVIDGKNAARLDLAGWSAEVAQERANAGALVGVIWAKRKGKSSPGDGYVIMSGEDFERLARLVRNELDG